MYLISDLSHSTGTELLKHYEGIQDIQRRLNDFVIAKSSEGKSAKLKDEIKINFL
jgi:hypothetical protein